MSENLRSRQVGVNAAFLMEIKDDHQQLRELLLGLRRMVDNPLELSHHFHEFVDQLYQLCDQLAFHFALEEAYGYFDDALESAPHLHEQSARLRDEHSALFIAVRDLADQAAEASQRKSGEVRRLIARFKAFEVALRVHESAEKGLILAAINDDVGVGD